MTERSPGDEVATVTDATTSVRAVRPLTRRTEKLSEVIAREIVAELSEHQWEAGTLLPPESVMLERYRVGRATLREALRILEVQGMVTIKQGPRGGPVVAPDTSRGFARMATLHLQAVRADLRQVIEARMVMEPVMAGLAAKRRDPVKLAQLLATLELGKRAAHGEATGYRDAATDFHAAVTEASGNSVMALFDLGLKDIYAERVRGAEFPPEARDRIQADHAAIAGAIAAGHADEAETLMRAHMQEWLEYVLAQYSPDYPDLLDEIIDWR